MREGSERSVGAARSRLLVALCGAVALSLASAAAVAAPPEFSTAIAAAERGDHAACSAEFERVGASAAQHGLARRAFYGGAVCAAQGGEVDRAFALLERAIALDFHDKERFYFDPRLQPLRVDPRWVELERKLVDAFARWRASLNPELAELAKQDQEDRRPGAGELDWEYVARRDRARAERVREIVAAGGARTPDDELHAALVLQHGEALSDVELAHRLAKSAAEGDADLPGARRLAATALDRALVQAGKPQKYGTQSVRRNGVWSLAEVDPAVSDAERALWEVPPLAESRERAAAMNGLKGAEAVPPAPEATPEVNGKPPRR